MQYKIAAYVFLIGAAALLVLAVYGFLHPGYIYLGGDWALTRDIGGWAIFGAFLAVCATRYCLNRAASRPPKGIDLLLLPLAKWLMITVVGFWILGVLFLPPIIVSKHS
jgi:hypothetical protein